MCAVLHHVLPLLVVVLLGGGVDGGADVASQWFSPVLLLLLHCRVDDQLNQVEQQPSDLHKAVYNFTNGPVGQATSKGVQTAAKLTMTATIEAAKAAAPVGKWALQQGFKAAVGLVGAAMQQDEKQRQQQKQQGKTKKKNS